MASHASETQRGACNTPHLMRFLEVMRGTRMAAPSRLLPVMKMPLRMESVPCYRPAHM
jgi:hypothetical protein